MIEKLLLSLLVSAAQNPQIRAFALELVQVAAKNVADKLTPDLVGELLPKLAGVFAGGLDEFAGATAKKILARDPDLPFFSDIVDISELLRKWLG